MGGVPALRFATAARTLGDAARQAGLVVPAFRSPPRIPGARRTIRRHPGGAVVSVRLRERRYADVVGDMVDGVLVANRVEREEAERLRAVLRFAVGDASPEPEVDLAAVEREEQAREERAAPEVRAVPPPQPPTLAPPARVAERQTQAA